MSKKNKSGFTEAQVTWLFILIAGTVFLLIFAKIGGKQKELGERTVSAITLNGLSNVLTSLSISGDVFHQGELPKHAIKFECDKFTIGSQSRGLGNLIIFSPNLIKGSAYLSMTLPWHVPFKITNFVYLTHPEVRYIFVTPTDKDDTALYSKINQNIPDGLSRVFTDVSSTPTNNKDDQNNYKVRIIYFDGSGDMPPPFSNTKDYDMTKLEIIDDKIKFYRKRGSNWVNIGESYYLDIESLLGAIFSEDKDTYECLLKNGFNALENVAGLYKIVEDKLVQHYTSNPICKNIHGSANSEIQKIVDNAKNLKSAIELTKLNDIKTALDNIESLNLQAESNSCVLIY